MTNDKHARIKAKFEKIRPVRKSGTVNAACLDWSKIKTKTWEAFFSKVRFTSGCWFWLGGVKANYGRFESEKREWRSHRWSFCAIRGPIPDGHDLDHMCENTLCVNPWHLQPLTRKEHNRITRERIKNGL